MLAPTRDLVAELNQRARTHRLATTDHPDPTTATLTLADGNHASVGDTVITRTNDRTLRTTATDWVKNGDRWQVTRLHTDGSLTVQHLRSRHHVTLPAGYVTASVELGYACTIHTAQGVTAEASHTLLTGAESRQLAYTAATRGRAANHLYLQVVGDGDPHNHHPPRDHPPAAPPPTCSSRSWSATTPPARPPPPAAPTTTPPPCSVPRSPDTSTPSTSPPNTCSAPTRAPASRPPPTRSSPTSPAPPPGPPCAPT